MKTIRIRAGRERSLLRHHPWVFEGSVERGRADSGETVRAEDVEGRFLAWAAYSPHSQIRLRAWSFVEAERIDAAFFARRVDAAVTMRERLGIAAAGNGMRLVHAEADGLPGVIVDRFGDVLSCQFGSAGAERWKGAIVDALVTRTGCTRVYERSDAQSREREGLALATGWLREPPLPPAGEGRGEGEHGESGESGATRITLHEHGLDYTLDIEAGHKTGFYLDQRDNRLWFRDAVRRHAAQTVLDVCSYTGGFSLAALAGGAAHVTSVDSSKPALERAIANVALNGFDPARHATIAADANATMRALIDEGRRFDAIVLDPPKLAPTAAHAERAARAYKDLNRLAFKLLEPGGLLCTYSCSGGVGVELFHKIVAGAAADAGVDAWIIARQGAAPDHPISLTFPEAEYLKGLALVTKS